MVKTLARIYVDTVQENIEYIKKLEEELYGTVKLHEMVHQALLQSAKNLTKKWIAGAKYLRTKYARDAIPEYPNEVLTLSLFLDASINLMDDLLDETFSREERALYIVELVRVLALRDSFPIEDEVRTMISNYFNKIIFVAVSEQIFLEKMKDKEEEEFHEVAYKYFAGRSLDMDLFLEIPLHSLKYKKSEIDEIVTVGRLFRSINLMKKDLIDLEHDIKSSIATPITIHYKKGKTLNDLVDSTFSQVLMNVPPMSSRNTEPIVRNLITMMLKEQKAIGELLRDFK